MAQNKTQISIGTMMLLMLVFSIMSAGFFYASRVDAIQGELTFSASSQVSSNLDGNQRTSHVIFIMFTFTSPLLLAGILASAVSLLRRINSER
ncbi:hypothetical protein N9D38_02595 [Rubripirellula sp.]|jgi:hypothetical protein|nr:hypothetical protein [Rubripirellula sp.]